MLTTQPQNNNSHFMAVDPRPSASPPPMTAAEQCAASSSSSSFSSTARSRRATAGGHVKAEPSPSSSFTDDEDEDEDADSGAIVRLMTHNARMAVDEDDSANENSNRMEADEREEDGGRCSTNSAASGRSGRPASATSHAADDATLVVGETMTTQPSAVSMTATREELTTTAPPLAPAMDISAVFGNLFSATQQRAANEPLNFLDAKPFRVVGAASGMDPQQHVAFLQLSHLLAAQQQQQKSLSGVANGAVATSPLHNEGGGSGGPPVSSESGGRGGGGRSSNSGSGGAQRHDSASSSGRKSYPYTFQYCVLCQKNVHSSKLPCHIRQCHVGKPMFQCPSCDFTSTYSKNNVKSHMVSLHGLAGDPISYMDQYAGQVEEFMKKCFPNVRGRGRPVHGRLSPAAATTAATTASPNAIPPHSAALNSHGFPQQHGRLSAAESLFGDLSKLVNNNEKSGVKHLNNSNGQQQIIQQQNHLNNNHHRSHKNNNSGLNRGNNGNVCPPLAPNSLAFPTAAAAHFNEIYAMAMLGGKSLSETVSATALQQQQQQRQQPTSPSHPPPHGNDFPLQNLNPLFYLQQLNQLSANNNNNSNNNVRGFAAVPPKRVKCEESVAEETSPPSGDASSSAMEMLFKDLQQNLEAAAAVAALHNRNQANNNNNNTGADSFLKFSDNDSPTLDQPHHHHLHHNNHQTQASDHLKLCSDAFLSSFGGGVTSSTTNTTTATHSHSSGSSASSSAASSSVSPPSSSTVVATTNAAAKLSAWLDYENLGPIEPRYLPQPLKWTVFGRADGLEHTVFHTFTNSSELIEKLDLTVFESLLDKSNAFLTDAQTKAIAEVRDRIGLKSFEIMFAVHRLDLCVLSAENVRLVMSIAPTDADVRRFAAYEQSNSVSALTDNEQFILQLSKIDRLQEKLAIMNFMGSFGEMVLELNQQLSDAANAAKVLRNSSEFHTILHLMLTFGNLINGDFNAQLVEGFRPSRLLDMCAFEFPLPSHVVPPSVRSTTMDDDEDDNDEAAENDVERTRRTPNGFKSAPRTSLLSILAECVANRFTHLTAFCEQCKVVANAAKVDFGSIRRRLRFFDTGVQLIESELQESGPNATLRSFLNGCTAEIAQCKEMFQLAKEQVLEMLQFFGETRAFSESIHTEGSTTVEEDHRPEKFFVTIVKFSSLLETELVKN